MANKRKLHHYLVMLRPFSISAFAVLFLLSGLITVLALRQNNLRMIELRNQVFIADERGEGVEQALNDLRAYVHGHMWTDLSSGSSTAIYPPIQLKHTYERLVQAEQERVAQQNQAITVQATSTCEARFPAGQIQERAKCVQDFISARGVRAEPVPKELYQFAFVSPVWSPDFAGFSLLVSAVLLFLLIVRIALEFWLRSQLDQ